LVKKEESKGEKHGETESAKREPSTAVANFEAARLPDRWMERLWRRRRRKGRSIAFFQRLSLLSQIGTHHRRRHETEQQQRRMRLGCGGEEAEKQR